MGQEKQDHGHREPEVPETKVSLTATKKKILKIRRQKKKKKKSGGRLDFCSKHFAERNYQNAH